MSLIVLKFGGTSVASRARWQTIHDIAQTRLAEGHQVMLVCSALSGVSDQLEALCRAVLAQEHDEALAALVARHEQHAADLGVDASVVADELGDLSRLAAGASLIGEVSPRLRARILSAGEILSTRLGAAFLASQGVDAAWADARALLTAADDRERAEADRILSARVTHEAEPALHDKLPDARVIVTQGFIARDQSGGTVLLGRGGSDTSAALLAAKLGASRCEIWTDVPGMYTANPRQVPSARLLTHLSYAEAQEIATCGAKVLHPRCIPPVRSAGIELQIRCTQAPEMAGTVIDDKAAGEGVKAVSSRRGITLVEMETVGMWQTVGFLARAFAEFAALGLSVDLVSTSETGVTVSLDPSQGADEPRLQQLLERLSAHCRPRLVRDTAAVSLVGSGIRRVLHRLGPVLELFEEHRIHMVSQASSDLNLTFVVDGSQEARLVERLHDRLFASRADLGPTWQHSFGVARPTEAVRMWWQDRRDELVAIGEQGCAWVYDAATVRERASSLAGLAHADKVLYAMKANPHAAVLRTVRNAGLGLECVSEGELTHVADTLGGLPEGQVLFTPNFAPRSEYARGLELGVHVTLDNLHPLTAWPELFAGREVFLRLDPGQGRGHHHHVRTAGKASKFGIAWEEMDALTAALDRAGATVAGLHAHSGSGVRTPENWAQVGAFLAEALERFPTARVLDVGGGLGVVERPGQQALDLSALDRELARIREGSGREIWLEPGRYVIAEAGVLLARVTQIKRKGNVRYVGVDTGMNSLIRPALYGAYHPIVNLTRLDQPATWEAHVVGPICESGDTLGRARQLPPTEEGDVLLIGVAGAYGRAMSSHYNHRAPAREVWLD
ncbi:MAG: bifunctional aspartate kinase/diaminopimelate decarboxylase [Deltaproteobacteria bacterium]|nr:MAG: bifunctional aspartate kinase/diaminopimelate decarboxylase [Deltaproteobacteria bacterium]